MPLFRRLVALGLLIAAQAALSASPHATSPMTYVALGDSLTAGFQSGGLTAQNQEDAYPAVIARLAHIPFGVPAGGGPGCPPPLGGPALAANSCLRINPVVRSSNFAVPGARVEDLFTRTAKTSTDALTRRLYTLMLGPQQTQVQAALKSRPRFITIWIGSNNVLDAVATGDPARATPPAQFEAAYRQLLDALAPTHAQMLLLTVPDITTAPMLLQGPVLFQYGLGNASCEHSENRIAAVLIFSQPQIDCAAPYALTPEKILALQHTVAAYNASIENLARARQLHVFDVAPLLAGLQRPRVNPESPEPFGPDFSQDGVHPSSKVQAELARAILTFGNAQMNLQVPLP